MNRSIVGSSLVAAALLLPAAAAACPVCFNARESSRLAFLWTAVVLTLVPLALVGGLILFLVRRMKNEKDE